MNIHITSHHPDVIRTNGWISERINAIMRHLTWLLYFRADLDYCARDHIYLNMKTMILAGLLTVIKYFTLIGGRLSQNITGRIVNGIHYTNNKILIGMRL